MTMSALSPNPEAMRAHILALFGEAMSGLIELAWLQGGSGAQLFALEKVDDLVEQAARWSVAGRNIYIGATIKHPHTAPFARTSDADAYAAWAYWLDLDAAGAVERAEKLARRFPPTLRVRTGAVPHRREHWWWRLEEPVSDMAMVRAQVAALAAMFGGDPAVCNPGRIMRLAGSIAWPTKPGRVVEMVEIVGR